MLTDKSELIEAGCLSSPIPGVQRGRFHRKAALFSGTLVALTIFIVSSRPSPVLGFFIARSALQSTRVPPILRELNSLSGGPASYQQSTALANALERRTETINKTGVGVIDNTTVVALAQADWYFQSGQDLSGLYRGRRLEIAEGHILSATKRFLQQRGPRLPVTIWTTRLQNGSVLTGRVPPPGWAQNPPSDLIHQGYIRLVRMKISEQIPELVRGTRSSAIMRPMEAAIVAYVLMTSDNGWIASKRAQIDLSPQETRSFLGDLGILIPTRP